MKTTGKHFICLIVTLATTVLTGCTIRVDNARETEAVRARSNGLTSAESGRDIQRAMTFWAEDAIVQPAGMPQLRGREATEALYHRLFSDSTLRGISGTPSNITVAESGDLAYEYGINQMVFSGPKGDLLDMGKYLLVWKKVENEWYIAALSFSSNAAEPAPMATHKE